MVGRGKQKLGEISEHFTSSAYLLAAEILLSFKKKNNHIDVNLSSSKKQQASAENQERLRNRKVIHLLLDCCRNLVDSV